MFALIMNIICTVAIMVIFKFFDKQKVNNLQAITINYLVCMIIGLLMTGEAGAYFDSISGSDGLPYWFFAAAVTGFLFILLFNLIARTTQVAGVTIATVATKISMIIPILLNVLVFGTSTKNYSVINLIGFGAIFTAIVLTSISKKDRTTVEKDIWRIVLPIILLICTGFSDSIINYANINYIKGDDQQVYYSLSLFGFAGISGLILTLLFNRESPLELKNVTWGILLGVPNYFSIYFLVKALSAFNNDGAIVFPYINIGVILLGAVAGVLIFSEKLNNWNYLGIVLAILGILCLAFEEIVLF